MRIETNVSSEFVSNSKVNKVIVQEKPETIKNQPNADAQVKANIDKKNQANEREVIVAIENANKHFKLYDRRLEFSIHEKTKEIMVKVINTEDDTIIREIPSEKILDMVAKLWEMAGIFVDEKR
jgi:flagellar protein FlaG